MSVCLTTMSANSSGSARRPSVLHRKLEGARIGDGRLVEHAGRHLHVLALQRRHDVAGGQVERLQAVGIEPDAHRIVAAAEHGDRADAVDAVQHIGDLHVGVVGDEERVARLVGRVEVDDHHQVGRGLGDGDADVAHVRRQPRLGDGHAVLHLHLRDIEIGAELERHLDGELPVARRVRRDVEHVLDAVDLLLERGNDGRGDDVGAGAGVLAGDVDGRRRDIRILRDRQPPIGHRAQDHEDHRDHGGKDRPVDEELGDAHLASLVLGGGLRRRGRGDRPVCGATLAPGRTRISPLMTTRSSALMPDLTTRRPSTRRPSVT